MVVGTTGEVRDVSCNICGGFSAPNNICGGFSAPSNITRAEVLSLTPLFCSIRASDCMLGPYTVASPDLWWIGRRLFLVQHERGDKGNEGSGWEWL